MKAHVRVTGSTLTGSKAQTRGYDQGRYPEICETASPTNSALPHEHLIASPFRRMVSPLSRTNPRPFGVNSNSILKKT
jgi:hypothetical protein